MSEVESNPRDQNAPAIIKTINKGRRQRSISISFLKLIFVEAYNWPNLET